MKTEIRSNWRHTLIVCGKCSKKLRGGFGPDGKTSLGKALRRDLALGKGRKARLGVIESKCLGICPRHAVVAIDAAAPGIWRIVRAGTELRDVADMLGLSRVVPLVETDRAADSAIVAEEPVP